MKKMGHARKDTSESVDADEALDERRRAWNCGGEKSMSMSMVLSDMATSTSGSDEGNGTRFNRFADCCSDLPRVSRRRDFHIRAWGCTHRIDNCGTLGLVVELALSSHYE